MSKVLHYVYTLAYPDGRVFYVGKGIHDRIHHHEREVRARRRVNTYKEAIIRGIWEAGGQVVKTKLASFETHEEAILFETALIFFMDGLTNLTHGGEGRPGAIVTEEHRRKLSEAQKGKPREPLTEEHRRKLSEALKGNVISEEHRRKMSEAHAGRALSAETRPRMSEARRGKPRSEETKRRISETQRGRPRPRRSDQHNSL